MLIKHHASIIDIAYSKIKWETCTIKPDLDDDTLNQVKAIIGA